MKRLITFVILAVLLSTAGFAAKQKDLSGPIAIKGELQQQYENFPAGTPVVIRKVVKMKSAPRQVLTFSMQPKSMVCNSQYLLLL